MLNNRISIIDVKPRQNGWITDDDPKRPEPEQPQEQPASSLSTADNWPGVSRTGRHVFLDSRPELLLADAGKLAAALAANGADGSSTQHGDPLTDECRLDLLTDEGVRQMYEQDVFYRCSRPVFLFLRAMGMLPFTRPAPGRARFKLLSPAMLYAVVAFAVLVTYVGYVGNKRMNIVRSLDGRFEESVIAYLFLVNILPVLIVPLIWTETGKFSKILNDWTDFELLYIKVSGKVLPLDMHQQGLAIAIGLPIVSSLSVVVTHLTMVDFHLIQIIPYCVLDNLTYMMGAYWYLTCRSLSRSATILAGDFKLALKNIGPAAMVADYRALWLRLSKLTRDTGNATSTTITFICLYLFFIITLSIYGLMSQLSAGFGIKDIGLAVTAVCNVSLLFFICDEAHNASHFVLTNFQKQLLMVELGWMNLDAQTEIQMFLRATEMNPSAINCGGYFDVNRNLFKGLLTTMVTYLVVLLQFQISLPDENAAGNFIKKDEL